MTNSPAPINKQTCIDDLYTLKFYKEKVNLYARSEAEAIQRGIQHFRPKKRERDLVTISAVISIYEVAK